MSSNSSQQDDLHSTLLDSISDSLREGQPEKVGELLNDMHPAEIAHLLESLPGSQREQVWPHVPDDSDGEILLHLNDEARAAIISKMEPEDLVAATEMLDTDDLADILPEMPQDVIQEILLSLETLERVRLKSVLSYDEDSAGGLMDLDTIIVRADITLDVVLRYLRRKGSMPKGTDNLFVVDRENHYLGILPLSRILTSDPQLFVAELMITNIEGILADKHAREVANLFEHRDLITAPVVDEENHLLGRITIDDVVDVIRDEADHSLMSMAGLNEEEDMFAPVFTSARRRSIWLGLNLLTAFLASWVIGLFGATIEKMVALAILMPIVASMGGIAGSQTLTLVIRGMALGQIGKSNSHRLLIKEMWVGVWNGLIWAIVIAGVAGLWFQNIQLGLIIAAAIVINLVVAAISGATIPLILKRYGADPALSGSVVLTTVTDIVGFLAFLGLATIYLI
ncbi:MAG: magnesium transporter [Gammaproteobacteria bacterium]|nr:magnesium transporter [Gammaproteobacteria bacterium]MCW8986140.1 magnesium transporter [Gammaproteobacteria bacterium]MCW9030931.1 magnesium transporter [Gammaproteobacteria bacterium]